MYKVSKHREELAEEAKCHWCGCSEQASAIKYFMFAPKTCFCSLMLSKLSLKSAGTEGRPKAQKLSEAACLLSAVSWGKSHRACRGDRAATWDKVPCPALGRPLCHGVGGAALKGIQRQQQAQVAQLNTLLHLSAPCVGALAFLKQEESCPVSWCVGGTWVCGVAKKAATWAS